MCSGELLIVEDSTVAVSLGGVPVGGFSDGAEQPGTPLNHARALLPARSRGDLESRRRAAEGVHSR